MVTLEFPLMVGTENRSTQRSDEWNHFPVQLLDKLHRKQSLKNKNPFALFYTRCAVTEPLYQLYFLFKERQLILSGEV